ncbi:BatD family protein [Rhodanobacter sp. DHB23]|uniref:BatD family protein n=1 Tax=Rhodanobacter sp. DHB23 TaxID=2775923 RepID=UPI00177F271C|nr:BatD family protein [Rhodanobacter sp. DHB23]MBD8872814.1 protein BatD [Rhodanobacter sp. DHB23]
MIARIKRAAIHGRTLQGFILLLCLLLPFAAHAADVQATLDRTTMQLGETVTLNLHIKDGTGMAMPDLGPLQQDFDILGSSQSSDLSIVNGQRSAELVIGVVLRPRHAGTLVVPSLDVGGARTAPLQLVVGQADPASTATADKSVFMESELAPQRAWVGQQLSYVVRLYISGNVTSGTLDAPQVDGVQLDQVGGDLRYDKVRGNRAYRVIERRYAVVPQHAGTLTIPSLGFRGVALDPNDPDSFFGAGTQVGASAPAQTVQVQAAPADWGSSAWLPARALSLSLSGWPDSGTPVRVGQPINLTMMLSATGLPAEALPPLSLPAMAGATVYPDQPKTATANDDAWLQGSSERKFAVMPERPGTLTLPATTLRWFDVTSGQEQTAEIPAHSITVLPAAGAAAAASVAAPPVAPAASASVAAMPASAMLQGVPWRWVALASLLLWLGTVLAWWLWRRRMPRGAVTATAKHASGGDARQQRQAFLAAARGDDAAAQLRSLLAWAQAERPAIRNAGELEAALADAAQRQAIDELQRRRYGNVARAANVDLAATFGNGFAWRDDVGDRDDGLPPLYPFRLE